MSLSRWVLLWLLIIGVLVVIEVAVVLGWLTVASFFVFILALMVISVLSITGAVFVGMFVSHRILSTKGFTPFEQEMLRMRQEVRELSERVSEVVARIDVAIGNNRKNPP